MANRSLSSKIVDRRKDEEYPYKRNFSRLKKFAKFYFVPIISVVLFFVLIIFTIIPNISKMFKTLDEVKVLKVESQELDDRITKLEKLQEEQARTIIILNKFNVLVPSEQSKVVEFREKVAQIAKSKGLEVDTSKAGESILDETNSDLSTISNNQNINEFGLIEIPSKFDFKGDFEEFRNFLTGLYQSQDFFIVNRMDLGITEDKFGNVEWEGGFEIVKYQFSEQQTDIEYEDVSEFEDANQEVVDFIEENFIENSL